METPKLEIQTNIQGGFTIMKKLLSLVLALALTLGLASFGFAKEYKEGLTLVPDGNSAGYYEYRPDGTMKFYIMDGATNVTREDVRDSKLDVRLRAKKGGAALDTSEIKYETIKGESTEGASIFKDADLPKKPTTETEVVLTKADYDVLVEQVEDKVVAQETGIVDTEYAAFMDATNGPLATAKAATDAFNAAYETLVAEAIKLHKTGTTDEFVFVATDFDKIPTEVVVTKDNLDELITKVTLTDAQKAKMDAADVTAFEAKIKTASEATDNFDKAFDDLRTAALALKEAGTKTDATNKAYVLVTFKNPIVSTKTIDFEYELSLTYNRRLDRKSTITVSGNVANYDTVADSYDSGYPIYMVDAPVVEANEYVRNAILDLGDGVTLHTNLFKGQKYFAHLSNTPDSADMDRMDKYAPIEAVYNFSTIGLSNAKVKLDAGSGFVYGVDGDGKLVYLGKANEELPYYTKMYVANKELDIEAGVDETPTEETPGMGGDDSLPNINDNPSTGR